MNGRQADPSPLTCAECRDVMQEYLDGTMVKTESMRVFLHLRECAACEAERARWESTFALLGSLPALTPPADFDRKILKSVPYESYRAMADLRRPRLPVFLEEDALPEAVRAPSTRLSGLGIAVASVVAMVGFGAPGILGIAVAAGLLPEFVVRLQGLGRKTVSVLRKNEG